MGVWGIGEASTTPSANVAATVSPTVDLVKDLVTEHIEKVKVTMWQTTNLVTTGQIEEVASTLSKEQIVGNATGADKTSFTTTTTTTTIPTTTPTTGVVEVTKDYRVFGSEVTISIDLTTFLLALPALRFLSALPKASPVSTSPLQ